MCPCPCPGPTGHRISAHRKDTDVDQHGELKNACRDMLTLSGRAWGVAFRNYLARLKRDTWERGISLEMGWVWGPLA